MGEDTGTLNLWQLRIFGEQIGIEENANPILSLAVYPNPFSRKTVIRYRIQDTGYKSQKTTGEEICIMNPESCIQIYDLSGRLVRTLKLSIVNCQLSIVLWDGRDENGKILPSGIYFVSFNNKEIKERKKVILIR
jgi:flagellar hook assembly protein FlgD